jgi:hypothetical protein
VTAAAPPFGVFLLPFASGRLGVAALTTERVASGFGLPACVPPVAFLLGALLAPGAAGPACLLATAFVSLPAAALYATGQGGLRRDRAMLVVFAATGIGALAVLLGADVATGQDPGEFVAARWAAAIPEMLGAYRASGLAESSVSAVARLFELTRVLLRDQLPGLVLALAMAHAALVVYGFGRASGIAGADWEDPSFSRFRTPLAAAALFVPAGLLAAVAGPDLRRPAADLLLPLGVLFFLRGLAIIRALLDRGRAGLVGRALVYALVFWMPFSLLLALGGLFDEFVDVRARLDRLPPPGGETDGP